IQRNRCLSRLPVSNDQLTLSPSDREHGINRQNTSLQRYTDRFTLYDAGSLLLYRAVILRLNFSPSVDRRTQRIHDPSDISFSYRNSRAPLCTGSLRSLCDPAVISKQNAADLILLNIL